MNLFMRFADMEYSITRLTGVAYSWATNVGESRKYKSKIELWDYSKDTYLFSNRIIATISFASIGMLQLDIYDGVCEFRAEHSESPRRRR